MNPPFLANGICAHLRGHLSAAQWYREECHLSAGVRFDAAAIVDGELWGFEVKSERDSLTRLTQAAYSQINTYSRVFDRVFLVCAPRWVTRAEPIVPPWWGIVRADPQGLEVHRAAELNPGDVKRRLSRQLWTDEARRLARRHQLPVRAGALKGNLMAALVKLPTEALREAVVEAIPKRPWR